MDFFVALFFSKTAKKPIEYKKNVSKTQADKTELEVKRAWTKETWSKA